MPEETKARESTVGRRRDWRKERRGRLKEGEGKGAAHV